MRTFLTVLTVLDFQHKNGMYNCLEVPEAWCLTFWKLNLGEIRSTQIILYYDLVHHFWVYEKFCCITLSFILLVMMKTHVLLYNVLVFVFCIRKNSFAFLWRCVNIYCYCKERHLSPMTLILKVQSNARNIYSDSFSKLKLIIMQVNLYAAQF